MISRRVERALAKIDALTTEQQKSWRDRMGVLITMGDLRAIRQEFEAIQEQDALLVQHQQSLVKPPDMIELVMSAYATAYDEWAAQCFDYTTMPEELRDRAHNAAREGFGKIVNTLSPIARPILAAEHRDATFHAKIESVIACAERDAKVNPQFAGGLEPIIALLKSALYEEP